MLLALAEQDSPMLLWLIVGGLMALGPVISSYIRVYEFLRGKSIDTANFVTREELAAIRKERDDELSRTVKDINAKIKTLDDTLRDLNPELRAIHRILGQLEGHDEFLLSTRKHPAKS